MTPKFHSTVEREAHEREEIERLRNIDEATQLQAMRACIVYARDRRSNGFDYDEWARMVDHALHQGAVPPHALEEAQGLEAQALKTCQTLRAERDAANKDRAWLRTNMAELQAENGQLREAWARTSQTIAVEIGKNNELREQLRAAEVVRDDARAASQRYLDEKRAMQARYAAQCEDQRRTVAEARVDNEELGAWKLAAKLTGAINEEASCRKTTPEDVLRSIKFLRDQLAEAQTERDNAVVSAKHALATVPTVSIGADGRAFAHDVLQPKARSAEEIRAYRDGWKKGVLESIDKLWAAAMSGVVGAANPNDIMLSMGRIIELLNILLQHPPEAKP
jgi:hypothetical protein